MAKTKSEQVLKQFGEKLIAQIEKGKNPEIVYPLRGLNNVVYDKKSNTLRLGNKTASRSFFNVAHAKKFLQTVLVASVSKNLIKEEKHASLRDVFYQIKRTIPGTKVNIVDEQTESLSPDEPVLVRINSTMQFMTGEEILAYAQKHGERIYNSNGKERYANVGLQVCAFNQEYQIKETPATLVIKHPSNKIIKITTASGKSVKVTLSHSLFVSDRGMPAAIEAKHLKVGDWIAVPRVIRINEQKRQIDVVRKLIDECPTQVLSLLSLKGNRQVLNQILNAIPREQLREFVREHYKASISETLGNWRRSAIPFRLVKQLHLDLQRYYSELKVTCKGSKHQFNCSVECDDDLAAVMGFLISEGAHSKGKRNQRSVTVSNKKLELLKGVEASFTRSFGSKPAGRIHLGKDGTFKLNLGYDLLSFIIEYAFEYGLVHAWDKKIPSFILDAPEQTVKTFIRWYHLGDGSCYIKDSHRLLRFHTTSKHLTNGITFLLLRLRIFCRTYTYRPRRKNHHVAYEVRVANREDIWKVTTFTDRFNECDLRKKSNLSGDKLINVGGVLRQSVDQIKLPDRIYKNFNWYGWEKQKCISRPAFQNSVEVISKFGQVSELLQRISQYDIGWDKVIKVEDCGSAPYTIDLAVPPTQNFIGGNGLIILHNSDKAIEDLEVMTGFSREQLHMTANKNGSVAGKVIIEDRGDTIDWSKLGSGGWSVPSVVEDIQFKKVNAKYVLYMEKAAVWERLHEDKFWEKNNCIIISSQGQTTRGIRRLLQRLSEEANLPIYVLTDFDCWGFYIYSVVKYGSIALAHASEKLTIPNVRFLGITADDITKYDLKKHLIKLNDQDLARMKQVSDYEWFKDNKDWQRQLKMMKEFGAKAEIQALSSRGISFISETYLPSKIKNQEFLN